MSACGYLAAPAPGSHMSRSDSPRLRAHRYAPVISVIAGGIALHPLSNGALMQPFRSACLSAAFLALGLSACSDGRPPARPGGNDITINAAWVRLPPPDAPVAAGYLTISNAGEAPDTLVSASSRYSATVEIHAMDISGDMMQMRQLPEGLPLPPNAQVELAPGGLHLMLITPTADLKNATEVPITLVFEHGGAKTVAFQVRTITGEAPAEHTHDH